jgi:diguanylate cyclase (GGDEF)-like protein
VREAELRSLSRTDSLTGVNNRRRFLDLLGEEVERSARYGRPLSLLMIDIDHFKGVNDERGHAAGDEALRSVTGAVARSGLRAVDFLGRLGGEEFAVALPETRCSEAMCVAERIRGKVEETVVPFDGIGFRVTVSVGVTEHEGGEQPDRLLQRADEALYDAKRSGRNRVRHR